MSNTKAIHSRPVTPKKPATFRIDEQLLNALQYIKDRDGTSVSEQIERALQLWLETMGSPPVVVAGKDSRMKHLETAKGVGDVLREDGSSIGRRQYHLSKWQEIHRVRTFGGDQEIEGMPSIEGTVTFQPEEVVQLVGESLVLVLEDGRRFPFFLQSTNGNIAARGNLG